MTEVYYKDIILDIPEEDAVPLTKQCNEVGDLGKLYSDFTRTFRVKRTRAMEELFENASYPNVQTRIPYTELEVQMNYFGMPAITDGRMVLDRVDDEYYYYNIFSATFNIFKELKSKMLGSLDLSSLDHTWNKGDAAASLNDDKDYQYLCADHSDDGLLLVENVDTIETNVDVLRPYVRVKTLFNRIMAGYSFVNDIDEDERYINLFMPIATLETTREAMKNLMVFYTSKDTTDTGTIVMQTAVYDPKGIVTNNVYKAGVNGVHYFFIERIYAMLFGFATVYGEVNSIPVTENIGTDLYGYYLKADLVAGDEISFKYTKGGFYVHQPDYVFRCYDIEPSTIASGSPISLNYYLPNINQGDFIKMVCSIFGLIPSYNVYTRVLHFWRFSDVLDNRNKAKDWSAYRHKEGEELSYRIGYAKKNHLRYKEDDDVMEGANDSFIPLLDENADDDKTLYELPLASTDVCTHLGVQMSRISWYETIPNETEYTEYKALTKINPRLVIRELLGHDFLIDDIRVTDEHAARAVPFNLMESVSRYSPIIEMLNNTKSLRLKFNLPVIDVINFDHAYPIYLDEFSNYFFVKRINNYIPNEICTVDLIRI